MSTCAALGGEEGKGKGGKKAAATPPRCFLANKDQQADKMRSVLKTTMTPLHSKTHSTLSKPVHPDYSSNRASPGSLYFTRQNSTNSWEKKLWRWYYWFGTASGDAVSITVSETHSFALAWKRSKEKSVCVWHQGLKGQKQQKKMLVSRTTSSEALCYAEEADVCVGTLWFIIIIIFFLLCLLFEVGKQCAVAFRRLLQLAMKWRLAGCSNNKVDLTRSLRAEATHVPCSSHATDLSKGLSFRASPAFFFFFLSVSFFFSLPSLFPSTCCALLSLISWQELGSRHVPIREQRYCGALLSANLRKSALCATGHVPALLALLFSDLKRERRKRANLRYDKGDFFFDLTQQISKKGVTPLTVRSLGLKLAAAPMVN